MNVFLAHGRIFGCVVCFFKAGEVAFLSGVKNQLVGITYSEKVSKTFDFFQRILNNWILFRNVVIYYKVAHTSKWLQMAKFVFWLLFEINTLSISSCFFVFFKFSLSRVFLKWSKYVIYKIMCFIYSENSVYLLDWNKGAKVSNPL